MIDLELPLGKRTAAYRFFEILPGAISYGMILLLIALAIVNPFFAAVYLLMVIITVFIKSIGIAYRTILGHRYLLKAQRIDWHGRLIDLEDAANSYRRVMAESSGGFGFDTHKENLRLIAADSIGRPKPSQLYNAVIIAAYNESYDVIKPTVESVLNTTYNNDQLIVCLAYEERGGVGIEETAMRLEKEYASSFKSFQIIKHPKDLPDEIPSGKGPNITYAGGQLQKWCDENNIKYNDVIITTLDSDNRPHATYFDYVSYEYIAQNDRKHLSYQPVALYFGNIWDAPAPIRVIATGNSFWTIISSMRPHTLRNFASHSQPMDALVEMGFWSRRSIVEDGHQYWRSYFYFGGNYGILPIYVPIYQDAVMSDTLKKTLIAQFKQLRRWAYGASDIPYVAVRLFSRSRNVPFWEGFARFARLVDGHVTLASMALLITFGGWVPLLINPWASRNITAHSLPVVISYIQQVAMVGLFITILLMLKMLPPRPARYKRRRTVGMVLQWLLMPAVSVCYNSLTSFNAQTHLMFGRYLDKFDVTDKATLASKERAKNKS